MSDTFITMIIVVLALIIMFVFPLMFIGNQNEIMTGDDIKTLADDFVNQASREGKLTSTNYYEFLQKLNATGNTYNVSLEIQILDNSNLTDVDNLYIVGENMYYSEFTSAIEEKLKSNGEYLLKQGDYIKVKIENTNITFGTQIKRLIYGILGKDIVTMDTNSSAIVVSPSLDASELAGEPSQIIDLRNLKWQRDYYWVDDEEEWDASNRWVNNGSISRIHVDRSENGANIVEMIGNSVLQGKGAAWVTIDGSINGKIIKGIKQVSFSYDLNEGDSFYDAGIMLNVTKSEDGKTLSGYLIAFCFREGYNYGGRTDSGGILGRAGYTPTADETGAILKFTYEIGNLNGEPEKNKNLMKDLQLITTFNASRTSGTGTSSYYRNRTYKGKVKIRVVDEGYLINISTGKSKFEYTLNVSESEKKTNAIGFLSEHHVHSCHAIGHFKLYNVRVVPELI